MLASKKPSYGFKALQIVEENELINVLLLELWTYQLQPNKNTILMQQQYISEAGN